MFRLIACQLLIVALASAAATVPFQPKAGFEFVGTAEGKIFVSPILPESEQYGITWQDAFQRCTDNGYRMATILSSAQNEVVRAWVTQGEGIDSRRWSWIDGTNFISQDTWFSLNTGKNLTFSDWIQGRPSTSEGYAEKARCLRWSHNSLEQGWWDVYCDDRHNVICETNAA